MPRKLVPQRFVAASFPGSAEAATSSIATAWNRLTADDGVQAALDRPGVLLDEYFRLRQRSPLGRIVAAATRLGEQVRTIVVVAPALLCRRAAAQMAATAHPHYDLLDLPHRGGRPRVVFLPPTLDNDLVQAALDVVQPHGATPACGEPWGLVVVGPNEMTGDSAETTADLRRTAAPFVAALRREATNDETLRERLLVFPTTRDGDEPCVGELVGGDVPHPPLPHLPSSLFLDTTATFALTAVGADVVTLLKGVIWFRETTKTLPTVEHDAVRLAEFLAAGPVEIVVWQHALAPLARTFVEALENTPLGYSVVRLIDGCDPEKHRRLLDAQAAAVVGLRRLHLVSDAVRRDRIGVAPVDDFTRFAVPDDVLAGPFVPMPDDVATAIATVRAAESAAGVPAAEIRCTRLNDAALGELCGWFATATLIAEWL